MYYNFFFFFQAEDGIRDYKVTGVQTCALPLAINKHLLSQVLNTCNLISLLYTSKILLVKAGVDTYNLLHSGHQYTFLEFSSIFSKKTLESIADFSMDAAVLSTLEFLTNIRS